MALSTVCQTTNSELSLSIDIALTVLDVLLLLSQTCMMIFYKFKGMTISSMMHVHYSKLILYQYFNDTGVDLTIKIFLYSFGCLLTALVVFFWIIYGAASCEFRYT